MIEIRGQQASDWKDVYAMRTAAPDALPYIRPDWVKDELAKIGERSWPMVAVAPSPEGGRVVARAELKMGSGRRGHSATITWEQHPDGGSEADRKLLGETIKVAERWWNRQRLAVTLPETDPAIALFEELGFVQEARLRGGVRIAGEQVDELALARLTGGAALKATGAPAGLPQEHLVERSEKHPRVTVRGGSGEDWEALHAIWSQPSVYWGTMQIPHPSADWNRERVKERPPPRFWPLSAEVEGKVVGNSGLFRDEHNRSHVGHLGMMVHPDYQGVGIGSALMEAVLDLAENWIGLSRLQLEVYTDNERAIGLYHKYDFQPEGVFHAFAFRDGHYVDALVMGRLRD